MAIVTGEARKQQEEARQVGTEDATDTDARISYTGECVGYGSYPWKYVRGLTDDEKRAVDAGCLVFVPARPAGGHHGIEWRLVTPKFGGHYRRRVPNTDEIAILAQLLGHWPEGAPR